MLVHPLNAELNPICYLLALLGTHHFLHISRIRVNYFVEVLDVCHETGLEVVATV